MRCLVIVILLLMILLRWVGAACCGFWFDEIYSLKISQYSPADLLHYASLDVHPSSYYFVLHYFMKFASAIGDSRIALPLLRFSSAAPNILLVLALAVWSYSRWGRSAGLAMLIAAGFAPGMVYYSIELRNYSMTMLCVGISCLSLIKVIVQPARRWNVFYVLFTLAFLHLHYLAMAIYACMAVFHVHALIERRRRGDAFRWASALWPHFVILLLLLPQLGRILMKYQNYYAPANLMVYNAKFFDLYRTFVFDFPAGPQLFGFFALDKYFDWFAQGVSLLFYAALGYFWHHDHQQEKLSDLDRTTLRLCSWMLGSFLFGTWFVSVMKWSLIFSGFRTAMLVLSLWILFILTVIETGIRARLRPLFRWSFALWMIPCSIYVTINRAMCIDDLKPLREYVHNLPHSSSSTETNIIYLDDETLVPWLQRVQGKIRIEPLSALIGLKRLPSEPIRVAIHLAMDLRVRSPREEETVSYIRYQYASRTKEIKIFSPGSFEMYEIPSSLLPQYISELKKIEDGEITNWVERWQALMYPSDGGSPKQGQP